MQQFEGVIGVVDEQHALVAGSDGESEQPAPAGAGVEGLELGPYGGGLDEVAVPSPLAVRMSSLGAIVSPSGLFR